MNADSFISDSVICSGMVKPDAAASGWGEANDDFVER